VGPKINVQIAATGKFQARPLVFDQFRVTFLIGFADFFLTQIRRIANDGINTV
jgi:hypothetical protein